ncbi:hypothetical protein ACOSQ3_006385 [Xanthoceras sorbifolium]
MRRELATSNFSSFLFSLLIFLLISEIQARRLQQVVCSSSCGDIKNISYPFRLKGDPARCGDHHYELSCQSNKTILEFLSGNCSLPQKSLSVTEIYDDNRYLISTYGGLSNANFLRCSSEIKSCSFISQVPIHAASEEYPPYEAIQKLLQSGFDLTWCRDCHSMKVGADDLVRKILSLILVVLASFLLRIISSLLEFLFLLCSFFPLPIGLRLLHILFPIDQFPEHLFPISIFTDYISNDYPIPYLPVIGYFMSLELGAIIIARFILVMVLTRKKVDNVEKFLHKQQSWVPMRYSYIEIIAITNYFRDKLGQGGFGSVYKGQLLNGSFIAVKVLENSKFSGEEFINEVSTIGRIHHANVVRLLGFCSEGSKRALVYKYMPNGSLDRHIFSKKENGQAFSWEKLHEIALGTARGIDYLHNGCNVCILHFDIKPYNKLLDYNFNPKVADFGLAKFYSKENDFICVSATRGTIGYIAQELISRNFGVVSSKSDVYRFRMLLLEIFGGRRNSFAKATRPTKAYFPSWVYDRIIEGRDLEIQNVSEIEALIARKLCIIGLWCIQVKATDRPSIAKVVEMLEGSVDDLQMPPKPFFSSSPPRCNSIKESQTDSSTELLEYSDSIEECSFIDHINVA